MLLTMLLFIRFLRQSSYDIFLRIHQTLAALMFYAVWRHITLAIFSISLYMIVGFEVLSGSTLIQLAIVLHRNLALNQADAMASLSKLRFKKRKNILFIDIIVARPWKVRAGQYINLGVPTFSLRSIFQSHSFIVACWIESISLYLCALVKPQDGLTRQFFERAHEVNSFFLSSREDRQISRDRFYHVWISESHEFGASVEEYNNILMIATGIEIAAQLLYVKKLIWGFNHCNVRIRRIHLVWQLNKTSMITSVQNMSFDQHVPDDERGAVDILNRILGENVVNKGYVRIAIRYLDVAHHSIDIPGLNLFCIRGLHQRWQAWRRRHARTIGSRFIRDTCSSPNC